MDQLRMKARRWNNQPYVTYTLLGITLFVFLMQNFMGGSTNTFTLIRLGAKMNELIIMGEWWRLITPMFLHIGFTHLLFNGLVIYFLGPQLEYAFGHWRFAMIYIFSALAGNAASFAFNYSISAGASTALFGMFGATLVLGKIYPTKPQFKALARNYTMLIILNVVFGLLNSGVDNAGHLGGLAGGYLLAFAVSAPYAWNKKETQLKSGVAYVALIIVLLILGWTGIFNINF
jgi:rhomboid protease GluP